MRWMAALGFLLTLVVAAAGPELVALERETGTELWRWSIPVQAGGYGIFDGTSRSFKALQVTETLVLVGLYRSVWALDVETGRERWHYGLEYDLQDVSVDSEFVYAVTTYYRGYLRTYALSPQDGRPRQTAEYRGLDARNLFVVLDGRRLWVVEQAHRRITAYDIAQAAQLWQEPNPNLNQPEFLGQDDRRLFLRVEMPRGKAPRLLAVDRMAGAQAFMVEDASFQSALKPPGQQSTFSAGAVPRPYLVVPGADVGLEAEAVLLVQQGTDLTAWPAYQPEPARRWSLFEEKELLNSITRRGRYLFLATVRPFSEELEGAKETPSALVQPTMRLVELPEGTVSATVSLPGVSVGVPSQSLIPVEHGLLHLGPAGLSFLAPVSREEAAEELHALRASSDLGRSERALLETLIAGLAPVELVARPCRPDFQVEVDGTLEEWSAVPAVRFGPKEEGWSELFPEIAEPRPPAAVPLAGGIRLAWDESWLYLAVEVDDELHRPNWAEGASWRSDALILRVLPTVHTLGLRKSLSLTVAGPIGRRRLEERTGGARASVHLGIGRQEGVTTYEVAVARSSLVSGELWPPPAGEFRMMLALTDRDDSGLREMLVFPPGPHSDRELDSLATVSFAQPPGEEP